MTRLILCSGKRASTPYHFKMTGVNIYSIEELCFYLYENIYMVTEEVFTPELCDFIERELNLPERAAKLKEMLRVHSSLKDLVVCILCSCDYYMEPEIKRILHIIDEIAGLSQIKRNKLLADQCLTYKNYVEAKRMYQTILNSPDAQTLEEKEIGNIFHNLGIIALHLTGFAEATELFYTAYEHNHNTESLHQYLFALRLGSNKETYQRELTRFTNGNAMDHMIREELSNMEEMIAGTNDYKVIMAMETLRKEGRSALYYREVDQLLNRWKHSYRQHNILQEG